MAAAAAVVIVAIVVIITIDIIDTFVAIIAIVVAAVTVALPLPLPSRSPSPSPSPQPPQPPPEPPPPPQPPFCPWQGGRSSYRLKTRRTGRWSGKLGSRQCGPLQRHIEMTSQGNKSQHGTQYWWGVTRPQLILALISAYIRRTRSTFPSSGRSMDVDSDAN
jgi:hypothetical protein